MLSGLCRGMRARTHTQVHAVHGKEAILEVLKSLLRKFLVPRLLPFHLRTGNEVTCAFMFKRQDSSQR